MTTLGQSKSMLRWRLIAAAILSLFALWLAQHVPSVEIAWVCALLLLTIYLFVFEIVPVDVAALTILVLLGLSDILAPWLGLTHGLAPAEHLFDGFASNAVIAIIAVMIIGAGLDKTGLMGSVAGLILRIGGHTERRVTTLVSATVGVISSFMQNVGAAALFLPVVSRISARTGLPLSRLLMPMGFCTILGGTITLVGSSPLILLNDLIATSNRALPEAARMDSFSLFSVTPVGLALLASGILFFVLAGRYVLPSVRSEHTEATDSLAYFREVYGLQYALQEIVIPAHSPVVGRALDDIEITFRIRVIALHNRDGLRLGPGGLARDVTIRAGDVLGVMGAPQALTQFINTNQLTPHEHLVTFADTLAATRAGVAEVVIPPGSQLIGKSARDLWLRKTYGISLLAIHRGGMTIREGEGVRDLPLAAGDTLVVHTPWDTLTRLKADRNFVVVTTEYPHEELRPHKVAHALLFFFIALGLVLFTELRLSVALMTGALGMVLTRVLRIEEAYQAVSWRSVFLLACLIPLGMAAEGSGTAAWIAAQTLQLLGEVPLWVLQAAIAMLTTFFTLVMSNVGATVLLVPLAVNIALAAGADPALFALTVAIAASNSFLLPTHQVNALILGPGGYRVSDFIRAGGVMTVLFLVVSLSMLNLVF